MAQQAGYVSRIPLEIFSEILGYLDPPPEYFNTIGDMIPDPNHLTNRTIKNLSLVCRHFYQQIYPFRLETIFLVHDNTDISKYKLGHSHRFCKAVVDGDLRARSLAGYVKRFAMGGFNLKGLETSTAKQLLTFATALSFMAGVQELYIFRTSITNDILNATLSLPPLKVLRLDDCSFPSALNARLLKQFSALHALDVSVRGTSASDNQHIMDDFLKSLCLSRTKSLKCTGSTSFHLISALGSLGPLDNLTYLHMEKLDLAEYKEILTDAIRSMPTLEHLHVHEVFYSHPEDPWLSFDPYRYPPFPEMPHLKYIYAPVPIISALVPGSQVSTIGIATETLDGNPVEYPGNAAFWGPIATSVQASRCKISKLDVPLLFFLRTDFSVHFPHLQHLTLRPLHINWPKIAILDISAPDAVQAAFEVAVNSFIKAAWPDFPAVTRLEFVIEDTRFEDADSLLKVETLLRLGLKLPALKRLVLSRPQGVHRELAHQEYEFGFEAWLGLHN